MKQADERDQPDGCVIPEPESQEAATADPEMENMQLQKEVHSLKQQLEEHQRKVQTLEKELSRARNRKAEQMRASPGKHSKVFSFIKEVGASLENGGEICGD